jgi:hypothetical protein
LSIFEGEALCLTDIAVRAVLIFDRKLLLIILLIFDWGFGRLVVVIISVVVLVFVVWMRLNSGKLRRKLRSAAVGLLALRSIGLYFVHIVVG